MCIYKIFVLIVDLSNNSNDQHVFLNNCKITVFTIAGTPLAQRRCLRKGKWGHATLLSSCKTSLQV